MGLKIFRKIIEVENKNKILDKPSIAEWETSKLINLFIISKVTILKVKT